MKESQNNRLVKLFLMVFCMVAMSQMVTAGMALEQDIIAEVQADGAFSLVTAEQAAAILYDSKDYTGVVRAVGDLQADIERVTGKKPELVTTANAKSVVIVGTLGKSQVIDNLVAAGKIDVSDIKGKWEVFVIATVAEPMAGVDSALVIVGSNQRGTIYGIYELSEQLGVSPWYWWADVPAKKRAAAYVTAGRFVSAEPKVKYRGIFINDEEPCFGGWCKEKFGGVNSKMYAHMFELILRLRGNFLWPAMWGKAFNENDPENPKVADYYGIVMGASHHEPMMRAQQEWTSHKNEYGNGQWNYLTNAEGLQKFWREGMERNKNYENVVTMSMRGDGDVPLANAGSAQENFKLLERIIADQRKILEEVTGKPASETPQLWALYSEVLEYFDMGMKIPDDMIVLLCDDNWGNVRRLPELNGVKHPGGYGMYYHVDLHGAPRAYQWLNMTQIQHMWEQLQLTYSYGVDKIWILNVGDLKPNEYPMDFFLKMAWNPQTYNADTISNYAVEFCKTQFGTEQAQEAARILSAYCKYASRVTAEMMNERTYNLESGEFLQVRNEFLALEAYAQRQYSTLADESKDAYRQFILLPVAAMANLYDMYYALAMNRKLAAEGDIKANYWADWVERCFAYDAELTAKYHSIAGGKWNHIMDQVHIGYTSWEEPRGGKNIKPRVQRVTAENVKKAGYVFTEKNGVVVMEAEHYFEGKASEGTAWTVTPDLGRTLSGLSLMPYTKSTEGSSLAYKMNLSTKAESVKIRIIFDSTLPFKNGAHSVAVGFAGGEEKSFKTNDQLTWANNYSKMYPVAAARINEIETTLTLPAMADGSQTWVIKPLDPGMVIHKVIVDCGGYTQTWLKMAESPYKR